MQSSPDGAKKRYLKPGKAGTLALALLLSLALTACGGGGSGGATGFADASSGKSPDSLEAVTLAPIKSISSSSPSTTPTTPVPTSGVTLSAPITGIPTDPGVAWGPVLRTFGDPPFKLNGPAEITQPLVFYSSNTGVATISGNTVTIVGAGIALITAKPADTTAPQLVGATIRLTVNQAKPNLSMPTVTVPALRSTVDLQASTRSPGAISYEISDIKQYSNGFFGDLGGNEGRTFYSFSTGTATITAKQLPTANYLGGTATGKLVVERRKFDIPLVDLRGPFGTAISTTVEAALSDEASGEFRTPTVTSSNPQDFPARWDEQTGQLVVGASHSGSVSVTFSLGQTTNMALVSKEIVVTFDAVVGARQPGIPLVGVIGANTLYPENYVYALPTAMSTEKEVTLKLCPGINEKIHFNFAESDNNVGTAHATLTDPVTLKKVELIPDPNPISNLRNGDYSTDIQALATGKDKPLILNSFVAEYDSGTGYYVQASEPKTYKVNVEVFPDPQNHLECYKSGGGV